MKLHHQITALNDALRAQELHIQVRHPYGGGTYVKVIDSSANLIMDVYEPNWNPSFNVSYFRKGHSTEPVTFKDVDRFQAVQRLLLDMHQSKNFCRLPETNGTQISQPL